MGDLGLKIALLGSLRREFGNPEITILSAFTNRSRPPGQTFDISELGALEKPGVTLYPLAGTSIWSEAAHLLGRGGLGLIYMFLRRRFGIRRSGLKPRDLAEALDSLFEADLIISKPGGFLYNLGETPIPARHHLLALLFAGLSGSPVVVYAQSIGPFRRPVFHRLLRFVLDKARLVTVRDEPSLRECQQQLRLRRADIKWTADEAFLLLPAPEALGRQRLELLGVPIGGPVVGATVVNWRFPDADDPSQRRDRYVQTMIDLIDHITDSYQAHVILFPFVLEGAYPRCDERITNQVHGRIKNSPMVHLCRETDPRVIKSIQAGLDVFVGSRLHSAISAMSVGVPALVISYMPKADGIMAMLGLSEFVMDINTIEAAGVKQVFDRLWAAREQVRHSLRGVVPEVQARARENARLTRAVLEEQRQGRSTARLRK
jgi:colanic acid/amylovoran biosynthesis protein